MSGERPHLSISTLSIALQAATSTSVLSWVLHECKLMSMRISTRQIPEDLQRAIVMCLDHADPSVREAAAEACASLQLYAGVDRIAELLVDERQPEGLRTTCAWAIACMPCKSLLIVVLATQASATGTLAVRLEEAAAAIRRLLVRSPTTP